MRKNVFKSIVIAVILLGMTGEFTARYLLGLGTPPLSIPHPKIEYMLQPNQDVYRFEKHFVVNQYGMRAENFAAKKPPEEFRVMVFGDSVVNGGALTDQSDLATSLLKSKLSKNYTKAVVGNISAGSWGPGNWLAYAEEFGFFGADVIALVISSHDAADNPTFQPLNRKTHPMARPISALWEGIEKYLPQYFPSANGVGGLVEPDRFGSSDVVERDVQKGLDALKKFLLLAKEGRRTVLVFQHLEKAEISDGAVHPGHLKIKAACSELGITSISLEPYFRQSIENGNYPYRDNIHPNEIGQRLIADAILNNLHSK